MKIERKRFCDWDERMMKRLKFATLSGGFMKKFLRYFPESPTIVIFSGRQVVGWASAFIHESEVNLHLFVNIRYRGRGLAQLLIREALNDFQVIRLGKHSDETEKLFKKVQKLYPGRVIIYAWYKNAEKYFKMVKPVKTAQK